MYCAVTRTRIQAMTVTQRPVRLADSAFTVPPGPSAKFGVGRALELSLNPGDSLSQIGLRPPQGLVQA